MRGKRKNIIFILFVIFAGFSGAYGQSKDLIVLQNADLFSGRRLPNGEDIRELQGNVRFKQGNVKVWCDKAVQFISRNEVELIGSVKVVRDTVVLTAKHGRYFGDVKRADCDGNVELKTPHVTLYADFGNCYIDEKKAFFRKNVRVVDSTTIIYSEQLTYFETLRKSVAILSVRIVNQGNNVTMFGNYLEHYDSTKYSKMTENPRLLQIDTTDKGEIDTLAVKSMVMESFGDSTEKLIATDSVVIVRGELSARCNLVYYYRQAEKIELFKDPIVWYEHNQVTGDTIYLALVKNRLQSATIHNKAFALSESDSLHPQRYNQLTGRLITMHFVDNKLDETQVERNAISLYFLYDKAEPNGVNKTSGDYIQMNFENGKPKKIRISKGIEGSYYPENMIGSDAGKYNLDGFIIHSNRPTLKTVFPNSIPL